MKSRIYFGLACVLVLLSAQSIQAEEKESASATDNLVTATVNDNDADDHLKFNNAKTRWTLRYTKDFTQDPGNYISTDTSQCDMKWKNITIKGRTYQSGLYGLTITFPFEISSPILKAKVISNVANYADTTKRTVFIEYSLNNKDFTTLTQTEFGAGNGKLEGTIDFSGKDIKKIWIRLRGANDANAKYGGSVVFHNIDVVLIGNVASK